MLLTLENLQHAGAVPVAGVGPPASLLQCAAAQSAQRQTLRTPPDSPCHGALGFRFVPGVNGSYQLSQDLLANIRRVGPLYGALAFDDPVVRNISSVFRSLPRQGSGGWVSPDNDEESNRRRLGASPLETGVPGVPVAQSASLAQLAELMARQLPGASQGGSGKSPLEALLAGGTSGTPGGLPLAGLVQAAAANPEAASALLPLLLGHSGGAALSPGRSSNPQAAASLLPLLQMLGGAQATGASAGTPGGLPVGVAVSNLTQALQELHALAGLLGGPSPATGSPQVPGADIVEALGALEKLAGLTNGGQGGPYPVESRDDSPTLSPSPPGADSQEVADFVTQLLSGGMATASPSGFSTLQAGPAGTAAPGSQGEVGPRVTQEEGDVGPRVIAAALRMANSLNVSSWALAFPQLAQAGGGAAMSMAETLMKQNPEAAAQLIWSMMSTRKEGRVLQRSLTRLLAPPLTLLHNASSYHALPSLLSGAFPPLVTMSPRKPSSPSSEHICQIFAPPRTPVHALLCSAVVHVKRSIVECCQLSAVVTWWVLGLSVW